MYLCVLIVLLFSPISVLCDDCYEAGSIVTAVIFTFLITVALLCFGYYLWRFYWKSRKGKHLVLETDIENVGDQYAFDNPVFVNETRISAEKLSMKMGGLSKTKWTHWSPLGALSSHKHEKRKTVDDSLMEAARINSVTLRSHDFTGLGFNVQGNMRDGIFIKDVLHRGPAFQSGKVNSGDKIISVKISFSHMVYEDALTILSYASPYEVELELETSPIRTPNKGGSVSGLNVVHPMYKSGSSGDLTTITKSARQRLFQTKSDEPDHSTLKSFKSNSINHSTTTLDRSVSPLPIEQQSNTLTKPERTKKAKTYSPAQLKLQLEQNLQQNEVKLTENIHIQSSETPKLTVENESPNRLQKFGIQVLPTTPSKTPETNSVKTPESDVVDSPRSPDVTVETEFQRQNSINSSGIKRDQNGIPQEIPNHMLQAANAARKNRKSDSTLDANVPDVVVRVNKKSKGKAPPPPKEETFPFSKNEDKHEGMIEAAIKSTVTDDLTMSDHIVSNGGHFEYSSDSDNDTDQNSVINNTIELNASDITIHHSSGNSESDGDTSSTDSRKAASLGDLSKYEKGVMRNGTVGTLERAQSLDISDTGIPTINKKRKAQEEDADIDNFNSDDFIYTSSLLKNKEPRLSLGIEDLTIFQTPRLKKSSQWGNLEDMIDTEKEEIEKNKSDSDKELTRTNIVGSIAKVNGTNLVDNEEVLSKKRSIQISSLTSFKDNASHSDSLPKMNEDPSPESKNEHLILNGVGTADSNFKSIDNITELTEPIENGFHISNNEVDEVKITKHEIEIANGNVDDDLRYEAEPTEMTSLTFIVGDEAETSKETLFCLKNTSESIFNNETPISLNFKLYDTNVSDDIKVSRHSLGSLERPKSDVLKNVNKLKKLQSLIQSDLGGVSNVQVNTDEEKSDPIQFQIVNDPDDTSKELYTTAIDTSLDPHTDYSTGEENDSSTFVTEIHVTSENGDSSESPTKTSETKFVSMHEETSPRPQSQIQMLRSNFEKKLLSPSKSKIPVAQRSSKSEFDVSSGDDEKEIIEIMSKTVHSTPITKVVKNPLVKNLNNKSNVTVTSIRTSSKIPSGSIAGNLPSRPPVPPRKSEETESMFQQWVFTQPNSINENNNVAKKN